MPDLLGHVAFARVVQALPPVQRATARPAVAALYYLGAVWPDLVTRSFHILVPPLQPYVEVLHAPLLAPLWGVVLAAAFVESLRRPVFAALLYGMLGHVLIDRVQYSIGGGYQFWFPLSFARVSDGLIWPEDSLVYVTPPLVLLALLIEARTRRLAARPSPPL